MTVYGLAYGGRRRGAEKTIRCRLYNISNGKNLGLESVLCGMAQNNMDRRIYQETKVTEGICARDLKGYHVLAADALSRYWGGATVF